MPRAKVEVKICGLSTPETLAAALDAGADYIGLVFFPKSPRNVSLARAAELAAAARGRSRIVALVVDADDGLIDAITAEVRPDLFQLHGSETPQRVAAITARTGIPALKALAVRGRDDVERAAAYRDAARILFDAKPPEGPDSLPGGNGLTFDWSLLAGRSVPAGYMLSGGLTPANVAEAIARTGAEAVDVSSGVEAAPGVKDPQLIRNFIEAARSRR